MFTLRKKKGSKFTPTKPMVEAAVQKGLRIGLGHDEIVEMVTLMYGKKDRQQATKIVAAILQK